MPPILTNCVSIVFSGSGSFMFLPANLTSESSHGNDGLRGLSSGLGGRVAPSGRNWPAAPRPLGFSIRNIASITKIYRAQCCSCLGDNTPTRRLKELLHVHGFLTRAWQTRPSEIRITTWRPNSSPSPNQTPRGVAQWSRYSRCTMTLASSSPTMSSRWGSNVSDLPSLVEMFPR
jgi:hypothetical protein